MSVVVWDGRTIAADRQSECSGLRLLTSKIRRLESGTVVAWTGHEQSGRSVARWYEEGADPERWPECQKDKETWSRLIVVEPSGRCFFYENYPEPVDVLEPTAWGSGRDFAVGAMAMGADARQAVEVAVRYSVDCGFGVEAFGVILDREPQLLFFGKPVADLSPEELVQARAIAGPVQRLLLDAEVAELNGNLPEYIRGVEAGLADRRSNGN